MLFMAVVFVAHCRREFGRRGTPNALGNSRTLPAYTRNAAHVFKPIIITVTDFPRLENIER